MQIPIVFSIDNTNGEPKFDLTQYVEIMDLSGVPDKSTKIKPSLNVSGWLNHVMMCLVILLLSLCS